MLYKNTIVFDLETTGTSTSNDRIVQFSATKVDGKFVPISEPKTILVNPTIAIPEAATKVHGITDMMVAGQPTFKQYANSIFSFMDGCNLAGYNIKNFDVPLLSEEFARCGIVFPTSEQRIIDAYKIFSIKESRDLAGAVKFYTGETFENGHDAGNDVKATLSVMVQQLVKYEDLQAMNEEELELFCNDGKKIVDIAGKLCYNDSGMICYAFGKDAGKVVKQNPSFGEWILKNDFPTETKKIIKSIIYSK